MKCQTIVHHFHLAWTSKHALKTLLTTFTYKKVFSFGFYIFAAYTDKRKKQTTLALAKFMKSIENVNAQFRKRWKKGEE